MNWSHYLPPGGLTLATDDEPEFTHHFHREGRDHYTIWRQSPGVYHAVWHNFGTHGDNPAASRRRDAMRVVEHPDPYGTVRHIGTFPTHAEAREHIGKHGRATADAMSSMKGKSNRRRDEDRIFSPQQWENIL